MTEKQFNKMAEISLQSYCLVRDMKQAKAQPDLNCFPKVGCSTD